MRIFFIGDIVGRPGRNWLRECLGPFREEYSVDWVIANGENAAGGSGITGRISRDLLGHGVDAITLGDHVWDQKGWAEEIDQFPYVCKPANLPESTPGRAWIVLESADGLRLGVFTLLGRQFMKIDSGNPFAHADGLIQHLKEKEGVDHFLVEIHAEATSEKVAMGWHLDGRVAAVLGTHTHIPTDDLCILPGGTAYQTDVGMTGPYDSVLGREKGAVIARFQDGMPRRFPVAEGDVRLRGALINYDVTKRVATTVEAIELKSPACGS